MNDPLISSNSISSSTDRTDRLRELSQPLADLVNPQTIAAMQLTNSELENRVEALLNLRDSEQQLRAAVHAWLLEDEAELVVDLGDDLTTTLHSLRENGAYQLHFEIFDSVLTTGRLPQNLRYLCMYCRDTRCGGEFICGLASQSSEEQGVTPDERASRLFAQRVPARVDLALGLVRLFGELAERTTVRVP